VLPEARRPTPPLPTPPPGTSPRAAFEQALLPALQRSPCLVSFSGGRDSSAVLAAATFVARREGLPLPIPATHRFPGADRTSESEWQERVVRDLGLTDWLQIEATSELDCVGPVATTVLRSHGVLWPCNAYFHMPIFEAARGGSVLTGIGGDEAFGASSWARALHVMSGRVRPEPRDLARVGFALAPARLKAVAIRRWLPEFCPWLRPAARREVEASVAAEAAAEPLRWRTRFAMLAGSAYMQACLGSLAAMAGGAGVRIAHPLNDPLFLATLAALPPGRRYESRSEAMQWLVGDLLHPALIGRATKARFDDVFFTEHSRELIDSWNGEGVDPEIVDLDRLRAEWSSPAPDAHTCNLLQSVWLSREAAVAPIPHRSTETWSPDQLPRAQAGATVR
jgi:asparagine synthetase B (glutamine-hydrolysing)